MIALDARDITAGYGVRIVISRVSFQARLGELALVVGLNGSGKSTLLKCVFGLHPMHQGQVEVAGVGVVRPFPNTLYRFGVSYWPQGMEVFGDLSVGEHLVLAARATGPKERGNRIATCFDAFPALAAKRGMLGSRLSGGEKQILAIATATCSGNRVLLLDEPCLGLSPSTSEGLLQHLRRLADAFGVAVVLVEHRIREALVVANTVFALKGGVISFSGPAEPFREPEGPERLAHLL
jgi:branched-chain amino acid transport system ATP-binding protein